MATSVTQFPTEYLDAIDEVLAGATYAGRYGVGAAEFAGNRQVSVPDISFGASPEPKEYDRFKTEGNVSLARTVYTLDHDVEKVFYIDAADALDEAALKMTTVVSEYERTVFAPSIDKDFFAKVAAKAKGKSTEEVTAANVRQLLRQARSQFTAAGLRGGDLYMTPEALACLEDATDRQWSNDTAITDTVGGYDGFSVFEVPEDTLGADFLVVSGGVRTVRYVVKRAATYAFGPGQHTQGDGWLTQMRWIYGTVVHKNKVVLRDVVLDRISANENVKDMVSLAFGEVIDNIIHHSESPCGGIACAQFYPKAANVPYIEYCVTDSGKGIAASMAENISYAGLSPSELVAKAFERKTGQWYGRVPDGTSRVSGGVGLSISAGLAAALDGVIWCVSHGSAVEIRGGKTTVVDGLYYPGTVIVVRLPVTDDAVVNESDLFDGGAERPMRWNPRDGRYYDSESDWELW